MTGLLHRVAGAPITWGVDPSPGWGYQLDRNRVLAEMAAIGLTATELGPDGWLPTAAGELDEVLSAHGLHVVGGFVPAVLYRPDLADGQLAYVDRAAQTLAGAGSKVMVLGPDSHHAGYDLPVDLDAAEWTTFLANLERTRQIGESHGVATALHPHWGMAVCGRAEIERVLGESRVELCIDTGHLAVAGVDPIDIARQARGRVAHVHLKDVDGALAARVRSGEVAFRAAVQQGLFLPLGEGIVDIAGFIRTLEVGGFGGWYVLEQDTVLSGEPESGGGPKEAAARSHDYLRNLEEALR